MAALRGAIVGFGSVAEHGHWPGYRRSAAFRIVAIVDSAATRRAAAGRLDPAVRVYGALDELGRDDAIDFVDICTPPTGHAALASEALGRGWHVLCEKPLTLDREQYRRLGGLAERVGRVLFTVHNWKMAPIVRAALEAVEGGAVGTIRDVQLFTWRDSHCKGAPQGARSAAGTAAAENWRLHRATAGGGVLVDHGWHAFYLVTSLVGGEPLRVRARLHVPSGGADALEDSADVAVTFAGASAQIHLTWRAPLRRNLIVVTGECGRVVLDDDRLLVMPQEGVWSERAFDTPLSGGSHHADWFGAVLDAFGREAENPAARGANLREAGWCVALTEAAYRAACDGDRSVEVECPALGRPVVASRP
ncbi:MAG: Gfo/Idh/MocA family oxidoreductase [Acidobacteria bacterium]|nr:Gfo/Idh/MocA family oxidoreductase [Acidobacteriota bacterium]